MDDFVIPTKTEEELEKHTIRFLKIAEKHNLCFKQSKCNSIPQKYPYWEYGLEMEKYRWKKKKSKQSRNGRHQQK